MTQRTFVRELIRMFHLSLLRKLEKPMAAALVPAFAGMSSMHMHTVQRYIRNMPCPISLRSFLITRVMKYPG